MRKQVINFPTPIFLGSLFCDTGDRKVKYGRSMGMQTLKLMIIGKVKNKQSYYWLTKGS